MMKICCPAGILFVLVPAVDCVLVAVPGNMISEKIIQQIFRVLNMLGYRSQLKFSMAFAYVLRASM